MDRTRLVSLATALLLAGGGATVVAATVDPASATVSTGGTSGNGDPGSINRCKKAHDSLASANARLKEASDHIDQDNAAIKGDKAGIAKVRTPQGSSQAYQNYQLWKDLELRTQDRDQWRAQYKQANEDKARATQAVQQSC